MGFLIGLIGLFILAPLSIASSLPFSGQPIGVTNPSSEGKDGADVVAELGAVLWLFTGYMELGLTLMTALNRLLAFLAPRANHTWFPRRPRRLSD